MNDVSPRDQALATLRDALERGFPHFFLPHATGVRRHALDEVLRVVMAIPGDAVNLRTLGVASSKVSIPPGIIEGPPVTEADIEAWLRGGPSEASIRLLLSVVPREGEGALSYARVLELVCAHDDAATWRAMRYPGDLSFDGADAVPAHEDVVVDAALEHPEGLLRVPVAHWLSDGAIARWVRGLDAAGAEAPLARLELLSRGAGGAPAEFARLTARTVSAHVARGTAARFFRPFDASRLGADELRTVLEAASAADQCFGAISVFLAQAGTAAAASALADYVRHERVGWQAAIVLGMMGSRGSEAAREAAADPARNHPWLAALGALPEDETFTLALRARPAVYAFDFARLVLPHEEPGGGPAREPIPFEAARQFLAAPSSAPWRKSDFEPGHWADLLQLASLGCPTAELDWAYAWLSERGELGRGAEPASLLRAVHRFRWVGTRAPLFAFLLGAEAPVPVLEHAIARFALLPQPGTRTAELTQHVLGPLDACKHGARGPLAALAATADIYRTHVPDAGEMFRWPALADAHEPGPSWEHGAPPRSLRLHLVARGARLVRVALRESVAITVDTAASSWTQTGMKGPKKGATVRLAPDEVRLDLETNPTALRFSVAGAALQGVDGQLFKLGAPDAPLRVEVEGRDALVSRVRLSPNYPTSTLASALDAVLFGQGKAAAVARTGEATVARTLALAAVHAAEAKGRRDARRALESMGAVAERYLGWVDRAGA